MSLATGTRLGTYEILAPLGSGGMGEVYRARDLRLGRQVALKVLPAEVAAHPERLARFEREARAVAGLNHPNIVVLYSVEDEDETRFLTMELVEGEGLDHHVTPGGLALPRLVDIGIALSDALTAAHEKGVVHRDLKPANVMMTRDGRVKVLDFGLARVAAPESSLDATQAATVAAPLSTDGQVIGTVPYMAPEQIRGETVDARSDLFSFGTMFYELASGRRPFPGASFADVSSAILRDAPLALAGVRGDLPPDLVRIVERCLEKNPRARFQTALDVCNELRHVKRSLESAIQVVPPRREEASIAVLPFANRSRDEDDEYFADGLADELVSLLGKIRGLRVAARSSAFTFKGRAVTVVEVGRALNVATVLEGSVRKAGNRVRISVQLVKVDDGYHLWSETYDRTLDDIFAVQDDIAQSVVKELRRTLLGTEPDSKASGEVKAEVAAAARGRGENPEAHRLFIHGRYLVGRGTAENVARGIEYLERALALDPDHAQAWAALSGAMMFQGMFGIVDVEEATRRSREAARKALALEPDLVEGHLRIAIIAMYHDFDWKAAADAVARARELAPGNDEVLRSAGMLALIHGDFANAIELCGRAADLDPLNPHSRAFVARTYLGAERNSEAEAELRRLLEIAPGFVPAHMLLSYMLVRQGRLAEAEAEARAEQSSWARLTALAFVHHSAGRHAESDEALRELVANHSHTAAWQIAGVYAHRGEVDAAFEWLERCYEQRDSGFAFVAVSSFLAPLREDPRWLPLLRRVGLDPSTAS